MENKNRAKNIIERKGRTETEWKALIETEETPDIGKECWYKLQEESPFKQKRKGQQWKANISNCECTQDTGNEEEVEAI